ncbi:MAG: hypothetical protein HY926_12470 [Elusimicrobia bacterium]|nr:hypothetical protein [Elusimicrobiota bacterium]
MPAPTSERPTGRLLLLVELMPHEPERQFRAAAYPLLMGLARALGWRASWAALGVRYDPTLRYRLEPGDLALLRAHLLRRRPGIVFINEYLVAEQWAALAALVPGRRLVYWPVDGTFEDFAPAFRRAVPEARGPLLDDPRLLDRLRPHFRRQVLNRAPWAYAPLIRVIAGTICEYRTPVSANPLYRGLRLSHRMMGCAFCNAAPLRKPAQDVVAFAARQVAAACGQLPARAERRFELRCQGLWRRLEEFIRELVRLKARRAELIFSPRIDELLATRAGLRRCLPLLAANGLAVRIYGMGVENFSAAENLRLNKGITARQVHEAAAFIAATAAAWPEQFRCERGRLSMILFTPWTTLRDLRLNGAHIARCPLINSCGVLDQRLQLFKDRPITQLAKRDGLVVERRGAFYNSGCIIDAGQHEVPWRFKHPEVGLLWALAQRLSAAGQGQEPRDELDRKAAELLERHPLDSPPDPLPAFRRAVLLMLRRPRPRTLEDLVEAMRR